MRQVNGKDFKANDHHLNRLKFYKIALKLTFKYSSKLKIIYIKVYEHGHESKADKEI